MNIFWLDLVIFSTHEAQGFRDILFWSARQATLDGGQGFLHGNPPLGCALALAKSNL